MTSPQSSPARNTASGRLLALHTLLAVERQNCFADDAFAKSAAHANLAPEDQALAFELVYGVLRHRATLDWQLNAVASRPVHRLPAVVAAILRLGAYQMRFLERIPVSAAVNESVKLAKGVKGRDWSGVVQRHPSQFGPDGNRAAGYGSRSRERNVRHVLLPKLVDATLDRPMGI